MTLSERITVDPGIRFGKPCIKGTRIAVDDILELLESDINFATIVAKFYPTIREEDVRACVAYAKAVVNNEEVHLTAKVA